MLKRAAAASFEVFLTSDQNIEFQLNLKGSELIIVVLVARTNKLEDLLPLIPMALEAIRNAAPGKLRRIDR